MSVAPRPHLAVQAGMRESRPAPKRLAPHDLGSPLLLTTRSDSRSSRRCIACLFLAWAWGCSRSGLGEDGWLGGAEMFDGGPGTGEGAMTTDGATISPNDGAEGSTKTGPGFSPPPEPWTASSYLINPAHTGSIEDPALAPPLARLWTAGFPQAVSYPLIADGRVYVVSGPDSNGSSTLTALDAKTGAVAWGPVDAGQAFSLALDGGRVFTLGGDTVLYAFDAATGHFIWKKPLIPAGFAAGTTAPPTAYRGIVYASASYTIVAADERDGSILWSQLADGQGVAAPALSDMGVFGANYAGQDSAFDRVTGTVLWHIGGDCPLNQSATPVLFGGTLYVRDSGPGENLRLDAATGATQGTFAATLAPAFHGTRGYYVVTYPTDIGPTPPPTLRAVDIATQAVVWTFEGLGSPSTSPVVVGGQVIVGTSTGRVFGLDEASGSVLWSDDTWAPLTSENPFDGTPSVASMAAGGGILVVPAGSSLIGYGHSARDQ